MPVHHSKHSLTNGFSTRHSRRNVIKGAAIGLPAAVAGTGMSRATAGPASTSSTRRTTSQDAVTLQVSVWVGDADLQAMEELGARFTEANPGVQIEYINIVDGGPYGRDKLQQMIAGGTPPDIMMLNTGQFEAFGSRGAMVDLDERIAAESYDTSIYWPAAVEGCKIDGKVYGLPRDISNVVMYLNTDLFEAAGVELPTSEWTWGEFREIAKQLTLDTEGDGQVNQWGISINNVSWSWIGFVIPNGGQVMNDERTECLLNTPEAIAALEYYYGLLTVDEVSVPPGTLPQTPGSGEQFLSGVTAMHIAGPWFRPGLVENEPFNWTVRFFPRPGDNPPASVLYTDQWSMSADTEHPDEAWALLKFLGGLEGQTIWSEIYGSRSITPIQELATSEAWLGYGGPEHRADNQTILDQLEHTVAPATNFADGAEVESIWDEQLELVMVGQQSVEQAVQTIVDSVNSVVQG